MGENKWKILIADDEIRIGKLIWKLIDWNGLNLECAGIVDNGEAAYDKILEMAPDIVITDIRMPKINGLELVKMSKEYNENLRFIIISGYKEFEYAHKALQYGVNDYLLKPINQEELNSVLEKLSEELSERRLIQKEQEELQKTADVSRYIVKRDLMNTILEDETPVSAREVMQQYHINMNGEFYRGIEVKLDYVNYEKNDLRQDQITVDKVMEIVEQHLKLYANEELICEKPNLCIYSIFNYSGEYVKEIKSIINEILSDIQKYLLGFEQYVVTVGVGREKERFSEVGTSIKEAQRAVGNRIRMGVGRLIYEEVLEISGVFNVHVYMQSHHSRILEAVKECSREKMEMLINEVFSRFQMGEEKDHQKCYELAELLVEIFFEQEEFQDDDTQELKQYLFKCIQHCYTLLKLKELLKNSLGEYLEIRKKSMEMESIKPIRKARQYIDEHFAEKITLEDVAEEIELNPVYFSVLFKKEMDTNFSSYLTNVRMEKAKELLRGGNETIAAVAEQVGYKDFRYFSQMFSKLIGVKPTLYRKLHS